MGFFDMYDEVYERQFKKTYDFTKKGLKGDLDYDIMILQETLETLMKLDGLDKDGRGEAFLASNNASIAATEVILEELIQEKKALA